MLEVVLLIVGIIKLVRRPRLKRLSEKDYPGIQPEKFREWKEAELKATDIFLWATWGAFFIKIIILIAVQDSYTGKTGMQIMGGIFGLWFIGLIIAAVFGSKAKKLRVGLGINNYYQPPPVSKANAVPNKIEELKGLYDKGLITEQEYNSKKKQLLDSM